MREKNAANEKVIEEHKTKLENQPESIEDRQARLKAQRDLIKKQKEEKRLKELDEFNK